MAKTGQPEIIDDIWFFKETDEDGIFVKVGEGHGSRLKTAKDQLAERVMKVEAPKKGVKFNNGNMHKTEEIVMVSNFMVMYCLWFFYLIIYKLAVRVLFFTPLEFM